MDAYCYLITIDLMVFIALTTLSIFINCKQATNKITSPNKVNIQINYASSILTTLLPPITKTLIKPNDSQNASKVLIQYESSGSGNDMIADNVTKEFKIWRNSIRCIMTTPRFDFVL